MARRTAESASQVKRRSLPRKELKFKVVHGREMTPTEYEQLLHLLAGMVIKHLKLKRESEISKGKGSACDESLSKVGDDRIDWDRRRQQSILENWRRQGYSAARSLEGKSSS